MTNEKSVVSLQCQLRETTTTNKMLINVNSFTLRFVSNLLTQLNKQTIADECFISNFANVMIRQTINLLRTVSNSITLFNKKDFENKNKALIFAV